MGALYSIINNLNLLKGIHDMTATIMGWEISIWTYAGTQNIKFEKKIQPEEEHEDE